MKKNVLDIPGYPNDRKIDNGSSGDTAVPDQPSPVVQTTTSKASSHSIENSESFLEDHVIGLENLTESQQLNKALLDSDRTSQGSLPQNEAFATESQLNKTDSFFQEIDRFKKSFKRTFEGYNDEYRESENMREILRFNSRHPSQQFGVESMSSKPNSLASKLEQEKKSMKSKEISSSTMSMKSLMDNVKSQSTEKGGRERLFMIKKVFGRPGVKKKQAMILQMGLNGMSEFRNKYTDNITSNGENDHVQSLDTSYDNRVKELQDNFRVSTRNNKIASCDVDREKYIKSIKSDPKTQETYSFFPTENYSILHTQNIVEVLDHIERQKLQLQTYFKPHKEFPTENGFISLIDRLEKTGKDNKKQLYNKNSLLEKVNISAYDLEVDYFTAQEMMNSHQNSGIQDKSTSALGDFATRHNLSLEEYLDSQRVTGGYATEGGPTSRKFDVEIDIQELNKVFLKNDTATREKKPQVRLQSQPRARRFYDSRAQNQSCMLPQPDSPDSPDSFTHKARRLTPMIRPREKKFVNSLEHNKSEVISVHDGEEFENYTLQDRANILKNQRKLNSYMVFNGKSEDKKYLVRPRKMNVIRQVQLQKCYGEQLRLNTSTSMQEKMKKKV